MRCPNEALLIPKYCVLHPIQPHPKVSHYLLHHLLRNSMFFYPVFQRSSPIAISPISILQQVIWYQYPFYLTGPVSNLISNASTLLSSLFNSSDLAPRAASNGLICLGANVEAAALSFWWAFETIGKSEASWF